MIISIIYNATKNQPQRTVKQLFDMTSKLVKERTEIQGISFTDWQEDFGKMTTLVSDRAVRLSTAKFMYFSDSVLCMGRIGESPVSARKEKIDWLVKLISMSRIGSNRRDTSTRVEKFEGFRTFQILADIQNMKTETQCDPEQFQGRIIFISMYNDIVW